MFLVGGTEKNSLSSTPFGILLLVVFALIVRAAELPGIKMEKGTGQLIVNGHPSLILKMDNLRWSVSERLLTC